MATLPELIERMRKESPAAMGHLNDRVVLRLLRAAFSIVARDIDQAADGVHKFGGLGAFRVRTVEPNAEGKQGGRRVLFKAAPRKSPKQS